MDKRVTELEKLCKQLNTNITALQTLVDAVSKQDYITNVSPIQYEGKVIGYTITFAKSSPITIYHGKDGVNGQDGQNGQDGKPGQDGQTPVIGVRKDVDGIYYWTLNGEWLLDDAGQKVKAEGKDGANGQDGQNGNDGAAGQDGNDGAAGKDGVTPQLKIENGMWYVSYNNGQTWVEVGPATGSEGPQGPTGPQGPQGPAGDSMFSKVDYTSSSDYVIFTLADGTQIKVPTWSAFESLKLQCDQMNKNIEALQTIVTALQDKDYVTSVTPIMEGVKEIGYVITFSKSGRITIYHGKDGVNGQDGQNGQDGKPGQDGQTPVIGVRKDVDGIYYWTLNGEWLLDDAGQKVKAEGKDGANGQDGQNGNDGAAGQDGNDGAAGKDGVTPQLKIENGMWYVSYNNGQTWVEVGPATGSEGPQGPTGPQGPQGPAGDSMFSKVDYDEKFLYLTLADGTQINVPRTSSNQNDLSGLLTVNPLEITDHSVTITGKLNILPEDLPFVKLTLYYSDSPSFNIFNAKSISITQFDATQNFEFKLSSLPSWSMYSYCICIKFKNDERYSKVESFIFNGYADLSKIGTANCYLISEAGKYKFPAVRGNTNISIGEVKSVEVLWESFGTDVKPNVGDLVTNASYSDGYICFETPATFIQGNAVIAAKDINGTILWSWHIWCSSEGWKEQVYFNNAGTMMDRNLGATTAQPNTVGALGLLYQWGRKDPFMGSASINSNVDAASTGTWRHDNNSLGTPVITEANPMTYYCNLNMPDYSWSPKKTAYDPCPAGWRIPDGGDNGIWVKALGSKTNLDDYSLINGKGMNLSGKFGSDPMISYPFTGYRYHKQNGALQQVSYSSDYLSCSPGNYYSNAYCLSIGHHGNVGTYGSSGQTDRSSACPVRCLKE